MLNEFHLFADFVFSMHISFLGYLLSLSNFFFHFISTKASLVGGGNTCNLKASSWHRMTMEILHVNLFSGTPAGELLSLD